MYTQFRFIYTHIHQGHQAQLNNVNVSVQKQKAQRKGYSLHLQESHTLQIFLHLLSSFYAFTPWICIHPCTYSCHWPRTRFNTCPCIANRPQHLWTASRRQLHLSQPSAQVPHVWRPHCLTPSPIWAWSGGCGHDDNAIPVSPHPQLHFIAFAT